jgi:hypothetical protein
MNPRLLPVLKDRSAHCPEGGSSWAWEGVGGLRAMTDRRRHSAEIRNRTAVMGATLILDLKQKNHPK